MQRQTGKVTRRGVRICSIAMSFRVPIGIHKVYIWPFLSPRPPLPRQSNAVHSFSTMLAQFFAQYCYIDTIAGVQLMSLSLAREIKKGVLSSRCNQQCIQLYTVHFKSTDRHPEVGLNQRQKSRTFKSRFHTR